jgi:hypothetical protein
MAWQNHFPNLRNLKLEICVSNVIIPFSYEEVLERCTSCSCCRAHLNALAPWLGQMQMKLKADKVVVRLTTDGSFVVTDTYCQCTEESEGIIAKMAKKEN